MHEKNARTLALLIRLCDDLAWGRPADEDALFALTREGSSSPELERLAEAFGMMIVKVEAREFHRAELLEKVEQLSQELEKSRLRMHEENRQVVETLQKEYNVRRIIGTDIGVGVTGLAGPDGDGVHEVGTVFVSLAVEGETFVKELHTGAMRTRSFIRRMAGNHIYDMMRRWLSGIDVM